MKQKPKKAAPEKKAPISRPRAQSVTLRLQPNILAALDVLAKKNGIPRSGVIQLAVSRVLKTGI